MPKVEEQVRLHRLLEWAKSRNIWCNDNIDIRSTDAGDNAGSSKGAGFGVFASGSAEEQQVGIEVRQVGELMLYVGWIDELHAHSSMHPSSRARTQDHHL